MGRVEGGVDTAERTEAEVAGGRGLVRFVLGLLDGDERALGEQVGAQVAVEHGVAAPQPLEGHGGVLLLLVAVVREHAASSASSVASTRWSYQSTASSSSMSEIERAVVVDGLGTELLTGLVRGRSHLPQGPPGLSSTVRDLPRRGADKRTAGSGRQRTPQLEVGATVVAALTSTGR